MGYFQVKYDSRVVIYNQRAFIRLAAGLWQIDRDINVNRDRDNRDIMRE